MYFRYNGKKYYIDEKHFTNTCGDLSTLRLVMNGRDYSIIQSKTIKFGIEKYLVNLLEPKPFSEITFDECLYNAEYARC